VARQSNVSILNLIFLLFVILLLLSGSVFWFDRLGLIDAKDSLYPITKFFGAEKRVVLEIPEEELTLEQARQDKSREGIMLQREELDKKEELLNQAEQEINQKIEELEQWEESLQDKEKSLTQAEKSYEDRRSNLEQNALYLTGMPPKAAVGILTKMADQEVIDHFRMVEEIARREGNVSVVSYWISLMDETRAAGLQQKMALKPGLNP